MVNHYNFQEKQFLLLFLVHLTLTESIRLDLISSKKNIKHSTLDKIMKRFLRCIKKVDFDNNQCLNLHYCYFT